MESKPFAGVSQEATLQALHDVLVALTELCVKAPRLDSNGRLLASLAEATPSVGTVAAVTTVTNITSLNGYGGGNFLVIPAAMVAYSELVTAENGFVERFVL